MINDHWILSLLFAETISLVLLLYAVTLGVRIVFKWNSALSDETQLVLERQSYLVSTLLLYAFGFFILSFWLFIIIANEHLPPLIRGAMCATGTLNANIYGWFALFLKIISVVLLCVWLIVHHLDRSVPEYPLTKEKFFFIVLITPFIICMYVVQVLYFINLDPNIITTCCSIVFNVSSLSSTSKIFHLSMDITTIQLVFYVVTIVLVTLSILVLYSKGLLQTTASVFSPFAGILFFVFAIVVFMQNYVKYIYGLPSHSCPFDVFWKQYYFIGYPIYGLLFLNLISSFTIGTMWYFQKKNAVQFKAQRYIKIASLWCITTTIVYVLLLQIIKVAWKINFE